MPLPMSKPPGLWPDKIVTEVASARVEYVQARRAYNVAQPEDGSRVLVERLWPRGITKEAAALDLRLKDIAPTAELRN
jgi:hypothetical protein